MAHRMFQTKIGFHWSVLQASSQQLSQAIEDQLQHAAYVRGIEPEQVHMIQGGGSLSSIAYVVTGPQGDDQGWDADGAPTAEYPGKTLPWPETPDNPHPTLLLD